jgi:SAM-dependent methyltransferase
MSEDASRFSAGHARAVAGDLRERLRAATVRPRLALRRGLEFVLWGGRLRERLFTALLRGHHRSVFRRQWRYVPSPDDLPHFMDHRLGALELAVGGGTAEPYTRGFFSAEVLREGDRLLDIGCGEGFFDRGFFSRLCSSIDAVDVEPEAIAQAERTNPAPNISYRVLDAVNEPFPSSEYDVVIWDGALGHFSAETTDRMLVKIRDCLSPDGVFAGSETLGRHEGHDHLQFFETLDDLGAILARHFPHVMLRSLSYGGEGVERNEAFWRCARSPERLESGAWRTFEGAAARSSTLGR